jgi:hypothetical protein
MACGAHGDLSVENQLSERNIIPLGKTDVFCPFEYGAVFGVRWSSR